MTFWLEKLVAKARIPYPLFFALEACLLYVVGLILAGVTGNLPDFITEPKWAYFIAFQAAAGAMVIYTLRTFDSSLDGLKGVMALSEEEFRETKRQLRKRITMPFYWILAISAVAWYVTAIHAAGYNLLDWGGWTYEVWWDGYSSPSAFYVYYDILFLPWILAASIFLSVVAIGLNLAYRKLCFKTPFSEMPLLALGTRPFHGFARLTVVTFACFVVAGLSYLYLWNPYQGDWALSFQLPMGVVYALVMALPAIALPHYFFYRLFSRTRNGALGRIESEITTLVSKGVHLSERRLTQQVSLLHQNKAMVESVRTSLVNVRIAFEFVVIGSAHLGLSLLVIYLLHI